MEVGTEQQWQATRKELLAAERELEEHAARVAQQRRQLPWVAVENEYSFATEDGTKTLADLFDGRSQLLIYHLMFGEDWEVPCPGCSSLGDGLSGAVEHLNNRDVTLSKQAANDLVRELEAKGYITLEPDPDDGRAKRIVATERGWQAGETAQAASNAVGRRWADLVGEERYAVFEDVLREICIGGS